MYIAIFIDFKCILNVFSCILSITCISNHWPRYTVLVIWVLVHYKVYTLVYITRCTHWCTLQGVHIGVHYKVYTLVYITRCTHWCTLQGVHIGVHYEVYKLVYITMVCTNNGVHIGVHYNDVHSCSCHPVLIIYI